MAVKTITPVTTLDVNEATADLVAAGTQVGTSDTFSITANGQTDNLLIFVEEEGSGAAKVTFDAGDNPPSMLSGLDDLDISLAQGDLKLVSLRPGQFVQSDGTITGSVATNSIKMYAVRIPREQ